MSQLTDAQLTRRFCFLQAAFFGGYSGCAFLSFLLLQKTLPTALIGVIGAVVALASSLVQPLWGILCDKYGCHRVFYILSGVLCPLIYYTISVTERVWLLLVCAAASGAFVNCMQNMANGWVAGLNGRGRRVDYGTSRGCGSFAYAVAAILYGRAVLLLGNAAIPILMAAFGVAAIVVSTRIPRAEAAGGSRREERGPSLREGLSILLHQREYMVFVLGCFLAVLSIAGLSTYYSVFLSQLGGNSQHVGLGNFVMAMAEVPFMLLYRRIAKHVPFRALYALCLACHALECILVAVSPNYVWAILAMLAHGGSFGLLVPCVQQFTFRHVEALYASTAQLFSSAVGLSASMIFGNLLGGFLSGWMPLRAVFCVLAIFPLAGAVLYLAAGREKKPAKTGTN